MKIASWNVNSLRVRLPQVLAWMEKSNTDIFALQETKTVDDQFPQEEIEAAGYHVIYSGQKTYNGVAILSRKPAEDVVTDIPGFEDPQRRILCATIGGVRILNLYVVNGQTVDSDKYRYKLEWLQNIYQFIQADYENHSKYVILGDFNIAPTDADVHDPELWKNRVLCSAPERDALQKILDLGFYDSFRLFEQKPETFSWWDYRQAAFRRNRGLRIDLILVSDQLSKVCTESTIDREPRNVERPSDHAPVWVELDT